MLSQTAEYALRAMVTLARPEARPRTTQEVATETRVPLDYLSKVLNALARAGLVNAQRGRGGGFQTARSPEKITIFEIVDAVEPLQRIRTCPLGLSAHGENLCPLHRKLDDAAKATEEAFRSTTLASISGGTIQTAPRLSAKRAPVPSGLCQKGCDGIS